MRATKPSAPEYLYDFPMPSTSTLPPVPSPTRKPTVRTSAPTRITYHTPHFSSSSKSYAPSSRAQEESRLLLDPSYTNANNGSGSSGNSPLSVFVDRHGDMHDPDYRHFPALPATGTKPKARPKWERGYDASYAEESDDEEEEQSEFASKRLSSYAYRPSYTNASSYAYTSSAYVYQPEASPASYDTHTLPDEDESPVEEKRESMSAVRRYARRHSNSKNEEKQSFVDPSAEQTALAPSAHSDDLTYVASASSTPNPHANLPPSSRPTCGQGLLREWHAMTLRLRFSVFRTKRKLRRRLGNG
ncbi:hypothetical protein FIBSPDRAFT_1046621 [Athelia psychrophila]|uniref:Uncharacterized protein n=1 Tax=Athelia psychrophila TaxID=1759441 RepID=A0A166BIW8_9AGAM|nr:hypothetical protein FIBSPDRAFT_1049866 [Fibularhizoctonia sp. CBS 109695]KZP17910.1 hypothetical protein FIBSPDRAFT_1046621 [Fibularhizoctonia sp. CBS 109695]